MLGEPAAPTYSIFIKSTSISRVIIFLARHHPERHPQAHASPRLNLSRRPSSSVVGREIEEAQTTCKSKSHVFRLPSGRSSLNKQDFGVARWSASQTLPEHVFGLINQPCERAMCDTRLALPCHFCAHSCMHNAPAQTHVRILNDLPVDCTCVSLTASFCVAHSNTRNTRTRLFLPKRRNACLGQIGLKA